jgi:hypothetical protein
MKHLFFLCVVFIISCNDNTAIVEEIKRERDSLIIAEMNAEGFGYAAKHVMAYNKLTAVDSGFLKQQDYNGNISFKSLDSMRLQWWVKSINSKKTIDSLELELKKE